MRDILKNENKGGLVVVPRQIPQPDCSVGRSTREHVMPVVKKKGYERYSKTENKGVLAEPQTGTEKPHVTHRQRRQQTLRREVTQA